MVSHIFHKLKDLITNRANLDRDIAPLHKIQKMILMIYVTWCAPLILLLDVINVSLTYYYKVKTKPTLIRV